MMSKNIFTEIYDKNSWGCSESKSGPGSKISVNKKLLILLEEFVIDNNIKKIIDLGCGDFNWMKLFNFSLIDSYVGIDIVEKMIINNNKNYSSNKISFECKSIIDGVFDDCDLIICKDVLFHFSFSDTLKTLENLKKQKFKYLLSTNFTNFKNIDIKTGGWRPINLVEHPFNLGNPFLYLENIENRQDKFSNKSIGLWKF